MEGLKIAELDFWDLHHSSFVQCTSCRLIQLDPMLNVQNTAAGCHAYYILDSLEISEHEQERNLVRNYRRGILFAQSIRRKGFRPETVLEFGPGSGYFSAGIRYVFPGCRITVVDILDAVLDMNREVHGFEILKGSPEEILLLDERKFDLVIARDILEHVTDIGTTIRNVVSLLNPNGLFHFLTPNGIEDIWGYWLNWHFHKQPTELLINHVNYFDGTGLLKALTDSGFTLIEYYIYGVGNALRGEGWKARESLARPASIKRSAEEMIRLHDKDRPEPVVSKEVTLNHWVFRTKKQWLIYLYCRLKHPRILHLDPRWNTGHEIHGLFLKK
jgi:SAM-dependent methyltransferase